MLFSQSLGYVQDAGRLAAQKHADVADSVLSEQSSTTTGTRMAWTGAYASRARGAHVLVGGDLTHGLAEVPNGYGNYAPLSTSAARALAFIRQSGIAPTLVRTDIGTYTTDVIAAVATALTTSTRTVTSQDLLDGSALTEADWTAARQKLTSDFVSFQLSTSDSVSAADLRYAAVVFPPPSLPRTIALARVRRGNVADPNASRSFQEDRVPALFSANGWGDTTAAKFLGYPVGADYAVRSVAHSIDYAADVI